MTESGWTSRRSIALLLTVEVMLTLVLLVLGIRGLVSSSNAAREQSEANSRVLTRIEVAIDDNQRLFDMHAETVRCVLQLSDRERTQETIDACYGH